MIWTFNHLLLRKRKQLVLIYFKRKEFERENRRQFDRPGVTDKCRQIRYKLQSDKMDTPRGGRPQLDPSFFHLFLKVSGQTYFSFPLGPILSFLPFSFVI